MKTKTIFTALFLIIFTSNVFSQKSEWLEKMQQVKLLSTNYEDVIKIFGNPIDGTYERELSEYFDIKEGRVFALFALGECVVTSYSDGKPIGWKVPAYTITDLSFTPNKRIKLKDFTKQMKLNLADFRSYEISDVPRAFVYENDKIGLDFVIDRKGKVEGISFQPPEALDYLYCQ